MGRTATGDSRGGSRVDDGGRSRDVCSSVCMDSRNRLAGMDTGKGK